MVSWRITESGGIAAAAAGKGSPPHPARPTARKALADPPGQPRRWSRAAANDAAPARRARRRARSAHCGPTGRPGCARCQPSTAGPALSWPHRTGPRRPARTRRPSSVPGRVTEPGARAVHPRPVATHCGKRYPGRLGLPQRHHGPPAEALPRGRRGCPHRHHGPPAEALPRARPAAHRISRVGVSGSCYGRRRGRFERNRYAYRAVVPHTSSACLRKALPSGGRLSDTTARRHGQPLSRPGGPATASRAGPGGEPRKSRTQARARSAHRARARCVISCRGTSGRRGPGGGRCRRAAGRAWRRCC